MLILKPRKQQEGKNISDVVSHVTQQLAKAGAIEKATSMALSMDNDNATGSGERTSPPKLFSADCRTLCCSLSTQKRAMSASIKRLKYPEHSWLPNAPLVSRYPGKKWGEVGRRGDGVLEEVSLICIDTVDRMSRLDRSIALEPADLNQLSAILNHAISATLPCSKSCDTRQYLRLKEGVTPIHLLSGVKNHLFFPLVYLSSKVFFTVFLASSLWLTSLNVSFVTTPFSPSNSSVYRVGIR